MVQKEETVKPEVVEQRLKPTLIRRRAKKVEAAVEEATKPKEGSGPVAPVEGGPFKAPPEVSMDAHISPKPEKEKQGLAADSKIEVLKTTPAQEQGKGPRLAKPSDVERKIGVVGYIDLGGALPAAKIKEDWRERAKRGPKRKKSKAELEMEAIQRVGGLKHYVGTFDDEVSVSAAPVEPESAALVGERIFQPVPSGRRKKVQRREFKQTRITEPKAIKKVIRIEEGISVAGLSQSLGIKATEIIQKLLGLGVTVTINQLVDVDTATLIAGEYGFTVEHTAFKEEDVLVEPEAKISVENLIPRAPVVTVMGHVDHGKTSILDIIRKSNVAEGEAGGITQHIGAYEVALPKGRITFIDTPGHEAFTAMRARGAEVTDMVVLVVAADDGIMPQTIEAIDHAKAANVPIVVAINKIDKLNAQPDRVKQALAEYGLVPEEWGGDTICVSTSAKTKVGIEHLLEMILIQAEVLELKANSSIRPKGAVIEARLDRGRGPLATVLVQEGMLKVGSYVVCGVHDGKIRAMFDSNGKSIDEAIPSQPVSILGLSGVPAAGDEMVGVADERASRLIVEQRRERERNRGLVKPVHASLEDLSVKLGEGETKELGVIIKTDVQGSVDAIVDALTKLSTEVVKLKVLHTAVGGITESDILLASASDAVVIGFNVTSDGKAREAAEREGVEVKTYRIIYEMIDEVRKAMEGLLAPEEKEVWLGRADVKNTFKITKVGTIAGCQVVSGKIQRSARVRLIRDQAIVFDGKISSLKRFKDDVRDVAEGFECGLGIENFGDIKPGDVIEAYIIEKKAAKL